MRECLIESDRRRRLTWAGVASATALAVLLIAHLSAPHSQAQAPKPPADQEAAGTPVQPPGDCWNGVLSDDPLHCYILEEAQREGTDRRRCDVPGAGRRRALHLPEPDGAHKRRGGRLPASEGARVPAERRKLRELHRGRSDEVLRRGTVRGLVHSSLA